MAETFLLALIVWIVLCEIFRFFSPPPGTSTSCSPSGVEGKTEFAEQESHRYRTPNDNGSMDVVRNRDSGERVQENIADSELIQEVGLYNLSSLFSRLCQEVGLYNLCSLFIRLCQEVGLYNLCSLFSRLNIPEIFCCSFISYSSSGGAEINSDNGSGDRNRGDALDNVEGKNGSGERTREIMEVDIRQRVEDEREEEDMEVDITQEDEDERSDEDMELEAHLREVRAEQMESDRLVNMKLDWIDRQLKMMETESGKMLLNCRENRDSNKHSLRVLVLKKLTKQRLSEVGIQ